MSIESTSTAFRLEEFESYLKTARYAVAIQRRYLWIAQRFVDWSNQWLAYRVNGDHVIAAPAGHDASQLQLVLGFHQFIDQRRRRGESHPPLLPACGMTGASCTPRHFAIFMESEQEAQKLRNLVGQRTLLVGANNLTIQIAVRSVRRLLHAGHE